MMVIVRTVSSPKMFLKIKEVMHRPVFIKRGGNIFYKVVFCQLLTSVLLECFRREEINLGGMFFSALQGAGYWSLPVSHYP